jgi:hypothetical protein
MAKSNTDEVEKRIRKIYRQKLASARAVCEQFAYEAEEIFRNNQGTEQGAGKYWQNQIGHAARSVEGYVAGRGNNIGFGLKHTVEYGPYLELANNRKHEALRPIVYSLINNFVEEVKKIFC